MSAETGGVGVAEPVTETKPKQKRSLVNQAHARELTTSEAVGLAAQNADRADELAAREIDGKFVTGYLGDVDAARTKAGDVVVHTTAQRNATAAERVAAKKLEAGMREVQKAAKQKYARTNRIALADYLIGEKLNGSRPNLGQTSQTLINRAASDELPGFTPAKIKGLGALRQTWVEAQETQAAAETAALNSRAELRTLLKSIKDRKIAIQLAVDAEWPHSAEENSGLRKEFALSSKSPLKV